MNTIQIETDLESATEKARIASVALAEHEELVRELREHLPLLSGQDYSMAELNITELSAIVKQLKLAWVRADIERLIIERRIERQQRETENR
jgi:hypothetical protein